MYNRKVWSLRGVISHASQETSRILLDHGQSIKDNLQRTVYIHATKVSKQILSLRPGKQSPLSESRTRGGSDIRYGRKVLHVVSDDVNASTIDEHVIQYSIS